MIRMRKNKAIVKREKQSEANKIPADDTKMAEDNNTVAMEDDLHIGSVDKEQKIIYVIKEKQDKTKSLDINTAVQVAAFIVSFIASIIAYYALDESKLQRENMYRPDLYIGETEYLADISDMSDIKYFPIVKDSILRDKQVRTPYLKINNIGMGTALHVDGTTTFRWELASSLLAKLKMPPKKRTKLSYGDVYMRENDSIILSSATEYIRWKTDYIMPVAQIGEEYMVDFFAPNFRTLINVSLWLMKNIDMPVIYFTFPIELSYKDINDKFYLRKREILIKCSKSSKSKDEFIITICSGQAHREFHDEMKKMMYPEEG